jgi:hypothetical protein
MKTSTSSGLLTQAFNPETFQQQGHQLVDMLSTYFAQVQEGTGISPFKHYHPDELVDFWQKKLEQKPTEDLSTFFEEVIIKIFILHTLSIWDTKSLPPCL